MGCRVLVVVLLVLTSTFRTAAGQGASGDGGWRSAVYYGGSDVDFAERMAVDIDGNAYLLGRTFSTDMAAAIVPATAAAGEPATATFVLKIGRGGTSEYAVAIGTGFSFLPLDIAVGADRTAHVLAREGDVAHVIKVDQAGRVVYDVSLNALGRDPLRPAAIAIDAGHAVIAGAAALGVFVARLDGRGALYDVHVLPFEADVRDLAVDAAGDAYIAGAIASDALPSGAAAAQPRYAAGECTDVFPPVDGPARRWPCPDAFLVKVMRGGAIGYATYFGGGGWDEAARVAVDHTGAAVLAGLTRSTDLPTVRAAQPRCNPGFAPLACGDAFVARIDPTGTAVVFATYLGGSDAEGVHALGVDADGSTFVGGTITGSGMLMRRAPQPISGGQSDGYVVALGPSGDVLWSTYVGGAGDDRIVGVGASAGVVYFGGETASPGWALGGAPLRGGRDLFAARVLAP